MEKVTHLLSHSREFEDVDRLIVYGCTLVDVDNHTGFASPAEKALQVVGQLTFSEGNMLKKPEKRNKWCTDGGKSGVSCVSSMTQL